MKELSLPMVDLRRSRERAFSLVELVIVIVIIGVLAAIAVPRLSRGATAASENALAESLRVMRTAIDLFAADHSGAYPPLLKFEAMMTQYSEASGTKAGDRDLANGLVFGPYLRAVPPLPVGTHKGKNQAVAAVGDDGGWVYDEVSGSIRANCKDAEVDSKGKKYSEY